MEKQFCTAIVLAAGSGKRMGTKVHKQYLLMGGRPVLYYSLKAFEDSDLIDEVILVTGSGEEEYCRKEIIDKYGLLKVKKIVSGGAERYDSVWNGLQETKADGFVFTSCSERKSTTVVSPLIFSSSHSAFVSLAVESPRKNTPFLV